MSKHLVKIEKITPIPFKRVEWRLSNICNYDCKYCPTESKAGDENYISIEDNLKVVDKLCELFKNERIQFTFTGGEPTLYPHLHMLFSYIKSKNKDHHIRMFTNGSRTTQWWKNFLENLNIDFIMFTYHRAQVRDINKFIEVVNTIHNTPVQGLVFLTCTDTEFDSTLEDFTFISERVGLECHLKKIHGPSLNAYNTIQNETFLKNRIVAGKLSNTKVGKHNMDYDVFAKAYYLDGSMEIIHDPQEFVVRGQNRFLLWDCDIGKDRIIIYSDKVYKGICQVGKPLRTVYDDFTPITTSTKCHLLTCECGGDILESKQFIPTKNIPILSR